MITTVVVGFACFAFGFLLCSMLSVGSDCDDRVGADREIDCGDVEFDDSGHILPDQASKLREYHRRELDRVENWSTR